MMKDEDPFATAFARTAMTERERPEDGVVGNRHYRFWWVIAAIVLLALWSMFTGSVTLKLSAANILHYFPYDSDPRILNDIDVLELEEREKMVRRMWDVYTHSTTNRLPRFWSEAFEAAYEQLASEVRGVREAAVSEIAKLSLRSSNSERFPPLQPKNSRVSRKIKQGAGKSVENIKAANTRQQEYSSPSQHRDSDNLGGSHAQA